MAGSSFDVLSLYKDFRQVICWGADGLVIGFNGSPNANTLKSMMIAVKAKDRTVFDFGWEKGGSFSLPAPAVHSRRLELSFLRI